MISIFESIVNSRIEAAAQNASARLDLSWILDDKLPNALFTLTQLAELNLQGNSFTILPAHLDRLSSLRWLDVRRNPLSSIISRPGLILDWSTYSSHRETIQKEHVVGLRLDQAISATKYELSSFPNLILLDLSRDFKNRREPSVERLIHYISNQAPRIEELDLFNCGLRTVPSVVATLRNLKSLSLFGNRLGTFPELPVQFTNLRILNLNDTGITDIPDWVFDLKMLEHLHVSFNELHAIPSKISQLVNLRSLTANDNNLEKLPLSFGKLAALEELILSQNQFSKIPKAVFDLASLQSLEMNAIPASGSFWRRGHYPVNNAKVYKGHLQEIPRDILRLEKLSALHVKEQPIETPPLEVVEQGVEAIKNYWRQRAEAGTDYLSEAKLVIVGEPGAGKTSLANKILNPSYLLDSNEKSTEGIDVLRWNFPMVLRPKQAPQSPPLPRDFHVNIWDFGGQEIYHATHQFFLTRRSVYVLVADSRKEDTDFHYWLNVVELFCENSPVIIVKNEKQDRRRDIDEKGLRSRFPNLREVLATNLDGNRGLEEVVRLLRHHLEGLPHIGEALPATWKRVREALERDPRNYISVEKYLRICDAHGFKRHEDKLQLSGYLHDLGICLHFQDDPVLKSTVILKPKWGTDAVYRVLDAPAVIGNKGRFSHDDLETIWSEPEYASMHHELLQLMMRFQLCYRLEDTQTYIAPQLLSATQPSYPWSERDNLVLKYRYEFMPKGIVTRLIVGLHKLIQDQALVWRSGVVLERNGARCEVIEDYPRREITVRATGAYPRELLAIVDHELDRIHGSFRHLKHETWVPCRCQKCLRQAEPHFYPFDVLRRFARDSRDIQCQLSYDMVDVRQLVDEVLPRRAPPAPSILDRELEADVWARVAKSALESDKAVFVSYARGGESEQVVNELHNVFATRGITLVRDTHELVYKDSIQKFMQRIGRGKCVVIVLSRKYLESHYCMFELLEIAKHEGFRDRVFPLVLPDTDLFNAMTRLKYVKYWEERIKALDAEMKGVESTNLEGIQEEINLYREIRATLARVTDVLKDMSARPLDSHRASAFSEVLAAIETQLNV